MYRTEIQSCSFPELRSAVRSALIDARHDLYLRAYQQLPPRYWGAFGMSVVKAMIELCAEAISSGNYNEFLSWVTKVASYGSKTTVIKTAILSLREDILQICSRLLSGPSPLYGEIFLQMTRVEQAVQANHHEAPTSQTLAHNPIDVAVDEIITALNKKDIATGEHSRAVSSWCHRIARKLGLSEDETAMVTRGGLIHDIGKTTVPLEILAAPRRLSDEEWVVMASHVTAGHAMLLQIPVLQDFHSIVRHHHERLDGGGYPDKLDRDSIPLLTRVVTVADCFNAMIGRRPYRRAMSPLAAIEEIRRHRSVQFDPDVTDAMTEVVYEMSKKEGSYFPPDWHWNPPAPADIAHTSGMASVAS